MFQRKRIRTRKWEKNARVAPPRGKSFTQSPKGIFYYFFRFKRPSRFYYVVVGVLNGNNMKISPIKVILYFVRNRYYIR